MDWVHYVAKFLLIIAGLNLGILGVFDVNVISLIFASVPVLVKVFNIVVGLSALYQIYCFAAHKQCKTA